MAGKLTLKTKFKRGDVVYPVRKCMIPAKGLPIKQAALKKIPRSMPGVESLGPCTVHATQLKADGDDVVIAYIVEDLAGLVHFVKEYECCESADDVEEVEKYVRRGEL